MALVTFTRPEHPRTKIENGLDYSANYTNYIVDGKLHRDHGPAVSVRDARGVIIREEWYQHGKLHNEKCPAVIIYSFGGEEITHIWYLNGKRARSDSNLLAYISLVHDCTYNKVDDKSRFWNNGAIYEKRVWYDDDREIRTELVQLPSIRTFLG